MAPSVIMRNAIISAFVFFPVRLVLSGLWANYHYDRIIKTTNPTPTNSPTMIQPPAPHPSPP